MQTFEEFKDFVKGRKIALFGNAKSVLKETKEIDTKYDIICRMNAGFPQKKEKYIGSRTDVLFLSMPISEERLKELNPKFIIWCTPKHEKMTEYIRNNAIIFPQNWWDYLYKVLNQHRPSTGAMAFCVLFKTNYGTITLYGFDHWKSETWYTNKNTPCHHSPKDEKEMFDNMVKYNKERIFKR